MFKINAMVRSLDDLAEVTILLNRSNNEVYAEYDGKVCTAIFNLFVGLYYVDDVYGVLSDEEWATIKER